MSSGSTLVDDLQAGRCPDCGWNYFIPGPRGGMSENVECAQCRARFNVARVQTPGARPEWQIVVAERIAREDEGGARWPPVLFARGERVRVTMNGQTAAGQVVQASANGISLVIEVEAWPGLASTLPVMFAGEDYANIITGDRVKIERLTQ